MGVIVDTSVLIRLERGRKSLDESAWPSDERFYVSVVTASELLMGVHRADTEVRRQRRSEFVESVLSEFGVLDFALGAARLHAAIYAEPATIGQMIGAHDLIIAATARFHDFGLLTDNVSEFSRVTGLRVIPFSK